MCRKPSSSLNPFIGQKGKILLAYWTFLLGPWHTILHQRASAFHSKHSVKIQQKMFHNEVLGSTKQSSQEEGIKIFSFIFYQFTLSGKHEQMLSWWRQNMLWLLLAPVQFWVQQRSTKQWAAFMFVSLFLIALVTEAINYIYIYI